MSTWLHDTRLAFRSLRRAPGFTVATVTTIALGFGAVTSVLAALYGVVLRPLPFDDSSRVVRLCETHPRVEGVCVVSAVNLADWAARSSQLDVAGVARQESFALREGDRPLGVRGAVASAGFLRVVSAGLTLGRHFDDADLVAGAAPVALVSHAFWTAQLGANPAAVGRDLALDGRSVRVVGVLAPDVYVPGFTGIDVWKPLTASIDDVSRREWRGFIGYARLRPGRSQADLRAELDAVRAALALDHPAENREWGVHVVGLREDVAGPAATTLWLLLAAAAVLGLVAVVNVASLVTVRTAHRAREFAVRAALGAGWRRLAWPLLLESLIVSVAGGVAGLAWASLALRLLVRQAPPGLPRADEIAVDGVVASVALGASVVVAFAFAVVALFRARRQVGAALAAGTRVSRTGGRAAVVVAQVAMAVVLLMGAGLLTRGLLRVMAWDPGFDRHGVMTAWLLAPPDDHGTTSAAAGALERVRAAVAAVPGVREAGLGSAGPLFGGTETSTAKAADGAAGEREATVRWYDVDGGYFRAIGRPILKGRAVRTDDAAGTPPVVVINETLATRLFGTVDPIGQRLRLDGRPPLEVVGVVADARPAHPDAPVEAEVFWPLRQFPRFGTYLVVRTAADVPVEAAIRSAIEHSGAAVQAGALRSIDAAFDRTLQAPRFGALLVGGFAASALGLAFFGIYAVVAFAVSQRTRELGVRIALGATPGRLLRALVVQSLHVVAIGIAIGVGVAILLARLVIGLVPGMPAPDPATLAMVVAAMAVVAAVATILPARHVTTLDPVRALGSE